MPWLLRLATLAILALLVGLLLPAGCKPGAVQVGSTSRPAVDADMKVDLAAVHNPTSQASNAGDQNVSGTRNVAVGGGNSIKLDGGTIIALAAIGLPIVVLGYLIGKGLIVGSIGTARAVGRARRNRSDRVF